MSNRRPEALLTMSNRPPEDRCRPPGRRVPGARVALVVVLAFVMSCASPTSERAGDSPKGRAPEATSAADPTEARDSTEAPPAAQAPEAPPAALEPRLVFAVKGDWGAGTREQAAVTAQMCRSRQATPFDMVVTTGDNFYNPDGIATQGNYYRPEACLISHPRHTWRASWGNHDVSGNSTATVLGAERYYRWSASHVDFFVLDSNQAADRAQRAWLDAQLRNSRAPVKVAVFHHAPYTVGLHEGNQNVIRNWVPLFERYGVSLVLTGHNHAYEHSVVNGVHYVITGGGGARAYPCEEQATWLLRCLAIHHFLVVEAVGETLSVKAIDATGGEIDAFDIPVGERVPALP
ncbi:MAG: metallophosphoesterase [Actinomycetota bacterium]|nr:metallophosphoesterase [Actinomycetota bacterium]